MFLQIRASKMFKNQKNDLRNFENPFLKSKNQIFILSQWMFPECHKSCEIHSKALFSSLRRYEMTSTVSLRALQSWKIADNHVRNFEHQFLKFKNQISTLSWRSWVPLGYHPNDLHAHETNQKCQFLENPQMTFFVHRFTAWYPKISKFLSS